MRHFQGLATALVLGVAPAFAVAQTSLPSGSAGGRSTTNNQAQQDTQGTQSQRGDDATAQGRDPRQAGAQGGREATDRAGQRGAQGATQFDDQLFLAAAREAGQAEILVSQLAVERASSDEVKQFARQMIEDHEAVNQQLMQGGQAGSRGGAGGAATPGGAGGTQTPGAGGARPGSADRAATDAAITGGEQSGRLATGSGAQAGRTGADAQAGAGGLAAGATEGRQAARPAFGDQAGAAGLSPGKQAEYAILSSKQGEEFDKCYMQAQVASHICGVALFEAESQMGQEYKELASQTLPKLKQHLDMAKQLCQKVDPSSSSSGAQHGGQAEQGGAQGAEREKAAQPDSPRRPQ